MRHGGLSCIVGEVAKLSPVASKGLQMAAAASGTLTHDGKTYFGPLIKSGAKNEIPSRYAVELNRDLIRLYGDTQWTAIDHEQRRRLNRKPLAQALHANLSRHRYPDPVALDFLRRITGSRNEQAADFKRKCRAALNELVDIGFLEEFAIDGDTVSVKRVSALTRNRHGVRATN